MFSGGKVLLPIAYYSARRLTAVPVRLCQSMNTEYSMVLLNRCCICTTQLRHHRTSSNYEVRYLYFSIVFHSAYVFWRRF